MASSSLLRLPEAGGVELTASSADRLPPELAALVGAPCRELRTRGDGACALHAAFATLGCSESLQLSDPRRFLRSILGHPLQAIRSRAGPAQQNIVHTVPTTLWDFVLLYGAETNAARNEEALFLSHLRRSGHWNRRRHCGSARVPGRVQRLL